MGKPDETAITPAELRKLNGKARRGGWPGNPNRWKSDAQRAAERRKLERRRFRNAVRNLSEIIKRIDASRSEITNGGP